jgi:hypothetical protein
VTPRERHDMRYIIGVAIMVVAVMVALWLLNEGRR